MAEGADSAGIDQLPLQGVVLCCTALSQDVRTKLSDIAAQMGATHKLDLTSDVTHLIVGSIATPKYRYVAKERPDIIILHPEWLETVRQAWMGGGEVHVRAMEEQHRLPPFYDLKICLTGFDNLEQRQFISETVVQHGADYHGDLTKAVTHLIAAAPQGAKYTAAKQWNINIVSYKWFEDSITRGMALDETLYDPAMPAEEQGQGAYRTAPRARTSLGKRTRDAEEAAVDDASRRKLRRTASTRLNSQSQGMWHDFAAPERVAEAAKTDQWKDEGGEEDEPPGDHPQGPSAQKILVRQSDVFQPNPDHEPAEEGLFSGRYILIHGFDAEKVTRLRQFLEPNGACVVQSAAELDNASLVPFFRSRHLLVPHAPRNGRLELPDVPISTELVTEWWVERCIHYKHYFDPTEDALSRPLWDGSMPGFAGVTVSTTGFSGVDVRQIAEAVQLVGAAYEEKLLPSVSVLVSCTEVVKKEKAYYAGKYNIPVVSDRWLWQCLIEKRKVPYDEFKVQLPAFDPLELTLRTRSLDSPAATETTQADSAEGKKEDNTLKRLSSTRKKRAPASLPLQTTRTVPIGAAHATGPFVHEDDDEDDDAPTINNEPAAASLQIKTMDSTRSQALQELSPNTSPRKGDLTVDESRSLPKHAAPLQKQALIALPAPRSPEKRHRSASPSKESQGPTPRPHEELTANLASIVKQRNASRSDSAMMDAPAKKRKNRPLGRSISGIIGARSTSASAPSETASPSRPPNDDSVDSLEAADGFSFSREMAVPPSTQIGYETADAETHRAMMEKRMKVKLQDESNGRRAASVGTVKNSGEADTGVGNRVRGRHRTKT